MTKLVEKRTVDMEIIGDWVRAMLPGDAADETLRFWRCFGDASAPAAAAKLATGGSAMSSAILRSASIR